MIGAERTAMEQSKTSPRPVKAADVVSRWIIDNAKVYTNSGASYGPGGENHLRMNLGTSRKLIELALDNIATAVRNL
jgi:bifunctional pyridoxal-dependent enzyme with beta-cystathionase and maltose regulon repressor activities